LSSSLLPSAPFLSIFSFTSSLLPLSYILSSPSCDPLTPYHPFLFLFFHSSLFSSSLFLSFSFFSCMIFPHLNSSASSSYSLFSSIPWLPQSCVQSMTGWMHQYQNDFIKLNAVNMYE
jgi:hypothetical protein